MFDKIKSFCEDHKTEIKYLAIGLGIGAAGMTAYFLIKDRFVVKVPLRLKDPAKDALAKKNIREWWGVAANGCSSSYGGELCVHEDPEVIREYVERAIETGSKYDDAKYFLMLGSNGNMTPTK